MAALGRSWIGSCSPYLPNSVGSGRPGRENCSVASWNGPPRVAACTMGRALSAVGARLAMPKPTVACPWDSARRKRVLVRLRRLARNASPQEPVFYEDEMDVHLNPKIGRDWMPRGHRRYVVTPGQNKKRFVAGALNATTGKMTWVDAPTKASELFHKLVWTSGSWPPSTAAPGASTSSSTTTSSTRASGRSASSPSSATAWCCTSSRRTAPTTTASSACGSTCTPT